MPFFSASASLAMWPYIEYWQKRKLALVRRVSECMQCSMLGEEQVQRAAGQTHIDDSDFGGHDGQLFGLQRKMLLQMRVRR